MDVNKLMSYIDNLTPQQAGGYLSGQQPFPYADMPRELWAPRMAAAAHQKLAAGGLVRRMDDRMAEMLARRFYEGGKVQGYAAGEDVDTVLSPERQAQLDALIAKGVPRQQALTMLSNEGIGKALATVAAPVSAMMGIPKELLELGKKGVDLGMQGLGSFMNTRPGNIGAKPGTTADNTSGYSSMPTQDINKLLSEISAEPQGISNPAAIRAAEQAGRGRRQSTASTAVGMPDVALPGKLNTSALRKELDSTEDPKTYEENLKTLQDRRAPDRTKERMARLTEAQTGLGTDRERDIWLSILQGAGAGMASGNRSFLGSLGTTVEKGAAGAAAAEKDYRTRKAGLEEKRMRIEDVSDAMVNDMATSATAMGKEQRKDKLAARVAAYGLDKDESDQAIKLAELKLKQLTTQSEIKYRDALGSAKAAGGNAFTAEDKTKMILAQKKVIMEKNPGIPEARAQEMARVSVEQSIADAMGMSGQGGGTDFVDVLPKGKTALR